MKIEKRQFFCEIRIPSLPAASGLLLEGRDAFEALSMLDAIEAGLGAASLAIEIEVLTIGQRAKRGVTYVTLEDFKHQRWGK